MRWRVPRSAGVAAGCLWLLPGLLAAAAGRLPEDEVRRRADGIFDQPGWQTELPPAAEGADPSRSDWRAERPSSRRHARGVAPPPRAGRTLAWVALLVAGLVLFVAVARRVTERLGAPPRPSPPRPGPRPGSAGAEPASDPVELAGRGHYGDAAQALLRRAIAIVERRAGASFPAGLTSRELARLAPLDAVGRPLFDMLVAAVERSVFGGVALSRRDYERCSSAFDRLAAESDAVE